MLYSCVRLVATEMNIAISELIQKMAHAKVKAMYI